MRKLTNLLFVLGFLFIASTASPSCAGNNAPVSAADQKLVGDGNAVTQWNKIATEIFSSDPGPLLDGRAFSIMHAAIHDAVNAIERRYKPYTADLSSPGASVEAAVASAARDVLIELSPSNEKKIEEAYLAALAAVPDGPAKKDGVVLGRKCAQANLERRANDGVATVTEPVYVPTGEPGDYDFTPPFNREPLGPIAFYPGFGRVQPFGIDLSKHRVAGPDSLQSSAYAADFNHVKTIGKQDSSTRTADQTQIAFFWFEELPIWNQIANTVIRQQNVDTWRSARILALLNFALNDALIANMEAKYHFRFWRPYTAIRRADEDGNPDTVADKEWKPLLWTAPNIIPPTFFIPPIPEYPSAAAVGCGAASEVLIHNFGDHVNFDVTSPTMPDVTRHFDSFTKAALEGRLSRVYGGIHFPHAMKDGFKQGKGVGEVIRNMLPSVKR